MERRDAGLSFWIVGSGAHENANAPHPLGRLLRARREDSRNETLWESLPDLRPGLHPCGLMLAARITLPHFSVSSAISLPNWTGDPGNGVPPRSARRAFILGSSRAALTSLLSLSTISAGMAFGAPRPVPNTPLVARQELTHGRDVRQR